MAMERRITRRLPVGSREYVTFSNARGHRFLCPIKDISCSGMMLNIPGGEQLGLRQADAIVINDGPGALRPLLRSLRGSVVWTSPNSCGIRFQDSLCVTGGELRSMMDDPVHARWADRMQ